MSRAYYTRENLGPKQSLTPEGFLLCEDVPIARTGMMVYGPGEVPVEPGPDGIIYIDRMAEDVFRPETITSFNGKPVTHHHPSEDVTPENWSAIAVGTVMNPRRGLAAQDDLLFADLLITNRDEIDAIHRGLREVSCGYDAEYIQSEIPGRAKQINIVGNHVALVENGRCGPRCSIGDQKTVQENDNMSWLDKIKAAFAAKDQSAFDAALAEASKETGPVTLTKDQITSIARAVRVTDAEHGKECDCKECRAGKTMDAIATDVKDMKKSVDGIDSRLKKVEDEREEEKKREEEETRDAEGSRKIEGELEEEAPPGTGDRAKKARDSAYLVDSFQEAVSLAEVIAPGMAMPTFDAKAAPKKTYDAICQFRRTVLDLAYAKPEMRGFMDSVLGGRELKGCTCDAVRTVFRAVGNFAKQLNNHATADLNTVGAGGGTGVRSRTVKSPADINKRNEEFYKTQYQ